MSLNINMFHLRFVKHEQLISIAGFLYLKWKNDTNKKVVTYVYNLSAKFQLIAAILKTPTQERTLYLAVINNYIIWLFR